MTAIRRGSACRSASGALLISLVCTITLPCHEEPFIRTPLDYHSGEELLGGGGTLETLESHRGENSRNKRMRRDAAQNLSCVPVNDATRSVAALSTRRSLTSEPNGRILQRHRHAECEWRFLGVTRRASARTRRVQC